MTSNDKNWRAATKLVRSGVARTGFFETSDALFLNSGYVYSSAEECEEACDGTRDRYVYSRYRNPTTSFFENKLAEIEEAEVCHSAASGMAAIQAAILSQVRTGDRVVASRTLFGSSMWILSDLLPRYGVTVELVPGHDLDAWKKSLSSPVRCVLIETPANPTLELVDIAAVADLTHQAGGTLIVDNAFASPILQKPLVLGADIVVYSATKHIDGQGRCLGGAVLGSKDLVGEIVGDYIHHTGPCLSAFNAWIFAKGLETLNLRVERHCRNTEKIAAFLDQDKRIAKTFYPGLASHPQHELAKRQMSHGGMLVSFELKGGKEKAYRFLNALSLIDISNNLGDAKSLICHPWTTTHQSRTPEEKQAMGISEGLLRLSVGLEDVADLLEDIESALAA